jgi:hypothetical protein
MTRLLIQAFTEEGLLYRGAWALTFRLKVFF